MEEKLEYLGLNLSKIPASIKKFDALEFRVPKFYDEKQYRQYRYIPIKDIQIMLSPTNRLDEIEQKYRQASPLIDYLDNKKEENILKHTTFLNMLKQMKIEDIVGTDAEQLLENVISEMKIEIVREALQCLTSREQQIIFLRYGLDDVHKKTQNEVAEIFGCSKSTIAKQEQKALVKMRHPRNTRKLKDFIDD